MDFNKKMEKTFFAAQIEKTEINILQKMGKKAFLLKMEAKNFLWFSLPVTPNDALTSFCLL